MSEMCLDLSQEVAVSWVADHCLAVFGESAPWGLAVWLAPSPNASARKLARTSG